jgi:hypothetical protein
MAIQNVRCMTITLHLKLLYTCIRKMKYEEWKYKYSMFNAIDNVYNEPDNYLEFLFIVSGKLN